MQQLLRTISAPRLAGHPTPAGSRAEQDRALALMTIGFATDPIARWMWPDPAEFLHWMPRFTAAFSGPAFGQGTADLTPCGRAASFWLPPGVHSDESALGGIVAASVPADRREEIDAFLAQMGEAHPSQPCWHLTQIAADISAQGQGLGSTLLEHGVRRCDAEGSIAYLESSNPINLPLYRRFGFEEIGEIQAGTSPVMHPMLRPPA